MSILTGINPEHVTAVHIINHAGSPPLAVGLRIPVADCILNEDEDWIQFRDPVNNTLLRIKSNRIVFIELSEKDMGDDTGPQDPGIITLD